MSLEDVERIMADTQDAIEYQRVCLHIIIMLMIIIIGLFKEIDELVGQNLTQVDEDAILQELEELLGGVSDVMLSEN